MRVVSTRVLPLPAPARISADACGSVTAASCSGLRLARRGGDMARERRNANDSRGRRRYNRAHSRSRPLSAACPARCRRPERRPAANSATMRAFVQLDPLGGAVRARVPRQDVRHRVRRRGRRRRQVPRHHPRPEPAAQPRHPPRRRARLPAAGRGDPRSSRASRAATRTACASPTPSDGLRARSRGPGARAHRGAAVARPRQLADGRRAQPRVDRQLHHRQADGRASTASTCSSPARCAASTPRRSSSASTTATSC